MNLDYIFGHFLVFYREHQKVQVVRASVRTSATSMGVNRFLRFDPRVKPQGKFPEAGGTPGHIIGRSQQLSTEPGTRGESEFGPSRDTERGARELVTRELCPQVNGAECSHHSECSSDCCLIDLDRAGAFCAPKARIAMLCLFQTKGAINIICPCQSGLSCISKDRVCSRRCHLI
uniref:colipase-like protein 2 n=1 Tax=Odobenus rosmarus divergens TaxID=9708 RepID=UPI00063C8A56|nr:PREDICTED: colipase-like protein 2 [Odobenus rosmarus divergens]